LKLKIEASSINFKTLIYLVFFSITILLFLIFSQSIILKHSYERYQERKIKNIAKTIKDYDSELLIKELESIVYDNSVCAKYMFNNTTISYNTLMVGCGLNDNAQIGEIVSNIKDTNKDIEHIKLFNRKTDTKAILSGIKVDKGYIFLYSPLEDLDGANIVLKSQVVYITIIVIVLACFISYFLSQKITNPITKITKKAKELGEGNYNIHFDRSDVLEIDELANTLNHVGRDLSRIDELRRDLMANVSHDLKTPLTLIKAYAEMTRDIHAGNKEKNTENMNTIIAETDRLTVLVNDILELSKVQSNIDTLKSEEFNLISMIEDILKRYRILEETEEYHFLFNHKKKKILIKADQKKLEQVIYNLINNAINYTGTDKTVTINIIESKETIKVEIIDTGKGIAEEDIPYIWDKYYKDKKKHKRNVIGTGLGLSIVKNILENHNFEYGVTSKKDKGSNFYFKIPKEM